MSILKSSNSSVEILESIFASNFISSATIKLLKLSTSSTGLTNKRIINLSYIASSPCPFGGVSLLAATRAFKGTLFSWLPFLYTFSFIIVNNVFNIAGELFHISSKNTKSAFGK